MEYISLAEALAHVSKNPSYIFWVIVNLILFMAIAMTCYHKYRRAEIDGMDVARWVTLGLVIVLFSVLFRPVEVANNTTKEQAARGIYIGY